MKQFKIFKTAILLMFASIVMAQDYEVYVSSTGDSTIKRYDQNGNYQGDFVEALSGGLNRPQDLLFTENNTLIVSGFLNTQIKEYNASNGDYIGNFSTGYSLSQPTRMVVGPGELIYVVQWDLGNNKVVRFDLDGNFVDEFTSIGVPQGIGIDWDNDGNMYVASWGQGNNGYVQKFDSMGNDLGMFIDSAILQGPTNIWFDDNGNLLVMDWSIGIVRRFDSNGNYIDDLITGMANPEGVAFLSNGNLLVGDRGTDTVELYDENGNFLDNFTFGNGLNDPNAILITDNILSVPDHKKNAVFVTPSIGNRFHINTQISSEFDQLSVYDSQGRKIDIIDPNSAIWDTSSYAEGMYFLITGVQGRRVYQRIIIKK
jgi:sugar lactone lactonase YvrE